MISIITPVLNEKERIGHFIANMSALEGDFELIFVDGGSRDGTLEEIERERDAFGHRVEVLRSPQGRARQMNMGAGEAKGDILLFLHVDSHIPENSLETIEREIHEGRMIGGGFTHGFSEPDAFLRLTSAFGNTRTRATRIFFGDFGIFIRKDIFERMGGYDELPFLEDVEFCRKAKKHGSLGQIDCVITTSPRRYRAKGRLRLTVFFSLAVLLNMMGLRPKFLYRWIVEM